MPLFYMAIIVEMSSFIHPTCCVKFKGDIFIHDLIWHCERIVKIDCFIFFLLNLSSSCVFTLFVSSVLFSMTVRELVVSAGESVEVTLPRNEVELNAFVVPASAGKNHDIIIQTVVVYHQETNWKLVTQTFPYLCVIVINM